MLNDLIEVRTKLPELGKYTVADDFASILIQEVLDKKPAVIVEAGSGVSTVFLAYCLEKIGYGRLLSFEHLEDYAFKTRQMLNQHGLTSSNVQVFHTPLRPYDIGSESYNWYDIDEVDIPVQIDLLIVDGPPRPTGVLARYPILPLFYEKLSGSAVVLLDDTNRPDEQKIASMWLSEFPALKHEVFKTLKGAIRFYKTC